VRCFDFNSNRLALLRDRSCSEGLGANDLFFNQQANACQNRQVDRFKVVFSHNSSRAFYGKIEGFFLLDL
jgi:hypothetical protein